jgi:hypothetical protein
VPFVEEARFYTDKEQLRSILRFFNDLIEDPYTSRIAFNSSGILDTSGGSRINYKIHPDLAALAGGGGSQITSLDIVN